MKYNEILYELYIIEIQLIEIKLRKILRKQSK